jgi:hypothetical protein
MHIDSENASAGNRAMAWVLLLYYHLLREGGITHEQTVYIDPDEFDAFQYLKAEVAVDQRSEISQDLIRQGSVIFLLCELNDVVTDYEADYLKHPFTQKILMALASPAAAAAVPESLEILNAMSTSERALNYSAFQGMLDRVFTKYVGQTFKALGTAGGA